MKTKYYFLFIFWVILPLFFIACKNGVNQEVITYEDSLAIDIHNTEGVLVQDTLQDSDTIFVGHKTFKNAEVQEAHVQVVKKYGIQWDFCKCVNKNDSINKALMRDNLSDEETDKILQRMDEVSEKCKDLLIQPNSTPEERYEYKKRVQDCLNQ